MRKKGNKKRNEGFPAGSVIKNLPANAADMGWFPDPEDPIYHRTTKPGHNNY